MRKVRGIAILWVIGVGLAASTALGRKPRAVCEPACGKGSVCVPPACAYTGQCAPDSPGVCMQRCSGAADCRDAKASFCSCDPDSERQGCRRPDPQVHPNLPYNVCYDPAGTY